MFQIVGNWPVEADGNAEALQVDRNQTCELTRIGRASGLQIVNY